MVGNAESYNQGDIWGDKCFNFFINFIVIHCDCSRLASRIMNPKQKEISQCSVLGALPGVTRLVSKVSSFFCLDFPVLYWKSAR